MNNKTWILVADSTQAKIYSTQKASLFGNGVKLELISEHEHPDSRKHERDLVTDKPGRFDKAVFDQPDAQRHEEEVFATELAKTIAKGHSDNHFQELIFIAPAAFMGMLHKHLPHPLSKLVNLTIEKDYTHCNENELVLHLQQHL